MHVRVPFLRGLMSRSLLVLRTIDEAFAQKSIQMAREAVVDAERRRAALTALDQVASSRRERSA
jgi:hypothetical protein